MADGLNLEKEARTQAIKREHVTRFHKCTSTHETSSGLLPCILAETTRMDLIGNLLMLKQQEVLKQPLHTSEWHLTRCQTLWQLCSANSELTPLLCQANKFALARFMQKFDIDIGAIKNNFDGFTDDEMQATLAELVDSETRD